MFLNEYHWGFRLQPHLRPPIVVLRILTRASSEIEAPSVKLPPVSIGLDENPHPPNDSTLAMGRIDVELIGGMAMTRFSVLATMTALLLSHNAWAEEFGTFEEAQALLNRAITAV